jgi:hypothetical protein
MSKSTNMNKPSQPTLKKLTDFLLCDVLGKLRVPPLQNQSDEKTVEKPRIFFSFFGSKFLSKCFFFQVSQYGVF